MSPQGLLEYATILVYQPEKETEQEVEALAEKLFERKGKVEEALDLRARRLVKRECYNVLKKYRGTAEEDKEILAPKVKKVIATDDFMAQDNKPAAAAVVRLRERAILKKTGDTIEFPADWLTNILNTDPTTIFKNPFAK